MTKVTRSEAISDRSWSLVDELVVATGWRLQNHNYHDTDAFRLALCP